MYVVSCFSIHHTPPPLTFSTVCLSTIIKLSSISRYTVTLFVLLLVNSPPCTCTCTMYLHSHCKFVDCIILQCHVCHTHTHTHTALITLPQPRFRPTGLDPRTFEKEYSAESGYSVPMRARQPSIAREAHADTSATRRPAQIRTGMATCTCTCYTFRYM